MKNLKETIQDLKNLGCNEVVRIVLDDCAAMIEYRQDGKEQTEKLIVC